MKEFRNKLNARTKKKPKMNLKTEDENDDLELGGENKIIEIEDVEKRKVVKEGEESLEDKNLVEKTGINKMKEFRNKLNARTKKKPKMNLKAEDQDD
jgi:hypothetical protein